MSYILGSDNEITLALIETHHDDRLYFEIRLKENSKVVGHISYHFRDVKIFGNVECFIKEEYRGNNYATKALSILVDNLYKIDDEDIYLAILPDNIPSIKSALACGAVFHHKARIPEYYAFSKNGKYTFANVYIIKNEKAKSENNKIKRLEKIRRNKNDRH